MKIALVGRYGEGEILSGPERIARELHSTFKNENIHVIFIEYFFSGYTGSSLYKKLFGKEYHYDNSMIRLGLIPLITFLRQSKFDIIHIINSQRFILIILLLNKFFTGKFVTTMHGFTKFELPENNYCLQRYFIDEWVEKLLVKKSRLLIFPSTLLSNTFKQYYKISTFSCKVIPNGISRIFIEQERVFPCINNSLKIIFYNGFNDSINRGLDKLLELLKNLKCEIELYVIGNKLELNHQNNINMSFSGLMSQKQLIKFISDKHFIMKSYTVDSFSILIAECMALGLIPIVNENTGIKDIIKHGENGFIYNSASSIDLAILMNEISQGNYDLTLISFNAKETSKTLSWGKITQEYISAYKSIL